MTITEPQTVLFAFPGRTVALDCTDPDESIASLKRRLSPNKVILTHGAKVWRDDLLLSDYNTNHLMMVHASVEQAGGCFMVSLSLIGIIILACISSLFTCGCSLLIIPFLLPLLFILPFFCL